MPRTEQQSNSSERIDRWAILLDETILARLPEEQRTLLRDESIGKDGGLKRRKLSIELDRAPQVLFLLINNFGDILADGEALCTNNPNLTDREIYWDNYTNAPEGYNSVSIELNEAIRAYLEVGSLSEKED